MINKDLKIYIESNIFPLYSKNEKGHQISHITYVINRCFKLSKSKNMILICYML